MRYLVARGANSQAELSKIVEVAKKIDSRIRPSAGCTSLPSTPLYLAQLRKKIWVFTMSRGSPLEPSHGETLGTATPVTSRGKRRKGAHCFCRDAATGGERAVPRMAVLPVTSTCGSA